MITRNNDDNCQCGSSNNDSSSDSSDALTDFLGGIFDAATSIISGPIETVLDAAGSVGKK